MKTGMTLGVSNTQYHADRTSASSTWLKIINSQTPFHLRKYLDTPPVDPTPALLMGSVVDTLVFEPETFHDEYAVAPQLNRRTKQGKADWAAFLKKHEGKRQVITKELYDQALSTAKAVLENKRMASFMSSGVPQPVFVWDDVVTRVRCKCKLDWYDEETGTIVDLKTAASAAPADFSKAVANFGYHIQAAFYSDGVRACGYPVQRFIFAVMEKPDNRYVTEAAPQMMAFYELDEDDIEAGRDAYASSLAAINFCLTNNEWAGYSNEIVPLTRPNWAKAQDLNTAL